LVTALGGCPLFTLFADPAITPNNGVIHFNLSLGSYFLASHSEEEMALQLRNGLKIFINIKARIQLFKSGKRP
jgi:hypothetical protein